MEGPGDFVSARICRRARWKRRCARRGFVTALIGGQSYFDRREIKDFLAYLKAIANPADDISVLRIANVPRRAV